MLRPMTWPPAVNDSRVVFVRNVDPVGLFRSWIRELELNRRPLRRAAAVFVDKELAAVIRIRDVKRSHATHISESLDT